MKIQWPKKIALLGISFAGCVYLAFISGTKFSENDSEARDQSSVSKVANAAEDSHFRTEMQQDGTRNLWIRATDELRLTQYNFSADGDLSFKTVYRINAYGAPLNCKIFDDRKTEIFKVSYGYSTSDGMLVEERVFDSLIKRLNDEGTEMPVRRVFHSFDAGDGSSKITSIDLIPAHFPANLKMGFKDPFRRSDMGHTEQDAALKKEE